MLIQNLHEKKLIHPPDWLPTNTHYLTIMGSQAYGCSDDNSDLDLYGFCIPRKDMVFPHLAGKIYGFDKDYGQFEQWQEHGIVDTHANAGHGCVYDFQVFGLVKYFALLLENNPNIIDSLFTPTNCVLHCTTIGNMVRDNRKMFLHKGAWHRFKGYAYSQLHKLTIKDPTGKRRAYIDKFGYDVKFGYHVIRLLSEVEQILTEGDIDLQRNNEQYKAIRRGEWTEQQVRDYFTLKEKTLEEVYNKSSLPYGLDKDKIRSLLMQCLECHFGSLDKCAIEIGKSDRILKSIKSLVRDY